MTTQTSPRVELGVVGVNKQPAEKPVHDDGPAPQGTAIEVVQVFRTIQGEGPFAGVPAVFIRLAGCNLQCPLCDTDYTSTRQWVTVQEIAHTVDLLNGRDTINLVVITGGEPLRQPIGPLVRRLADRYKVQIETNGTLYEKTLGEETSISDYVLVCSPKAGINPRLLPDIKYFKYVVRAGYIDPEDGLPTRALDCDARPGRPSVGKPVYVQPCDEGDEQRNKLNTLAAIESCQKFGYILCLQLHKIIGLP